MKRVVAAISVFAVTAAVLAGPVPSRQPAAEAAGWRIKIFSVGTPAARIDEALRNRYVTGVSARFAWSTIEPQKGRFRWGPIDEVIRKARAHGKQAMIRVIAGIYTPDWVKRRTPTLTFADTYLYNPSRYPSTVTMPIPWKRTYKRLWSRFVHKLGNRYDGRAGLYAVHIAGGGFIGEMTLPTDVQKWKANGYTDARYARTWKRMISYYRDAFRRTPIALNIVEPWGDAGRSDVVDPVVRFALRKDRKHPYVQSNALRADMLGWIGPYRGTVRESRDRTKVGYQMIGDAPTVSWLRDACTVAVQDRVDYVEVYASDVLASVNQPTLHYLASGGSA
jgi:hypothetical protein